MRRLRQPIYIHNLLEFSASRAPNKSALICADRAWSYAQLDEAADRFAGALHLRGFHPRDRVAIVLPNCAEAIIAFFGTLKAGGIAVMVNPDSKTSKLDSILKDSGATYLVILHSRYADVIQHALIFQVVVVPGLDNEHTSTASPTSYDWNTFLSDVSLTSRSAFLTDQDIACLIYTSGSTGVPKGVMCPHISIMSAVRSITEYLDHTDDDVVVNVLPLSFDHGLYQVLLMFYVGGTVLLEKNFNAPYTTLGRMSKCHVTGFPGVPTVFALLLQMRLNVEWLSSLRYIASTGAVWSPTHIGKLRKLFPCVSLFSMYGITECKRVSFLPPDEIDHRPTSIGRGMPNEELWLVDESGNRVGLGQVGELVVRGTHVMRGYWNDPELTRQVYRTYGDYSERALYTGDLMRTDEDGYLYYVGRRDDLIKTRGEKVYPREIEEALYELPEIVEAAVVGRPDDVLGQKIVAYVVTKPGTTIAPGNILERLASKLDRHAVPTEIQFRDRLPKGSSGKIDKQSL